MHSFVKGGTRTMTMQESLYIELSYILYYITITRQNKEYNIMQE